MIFNHSKTIRSDECNPPLQNDKYFNIFFISQDENYTKHVTKSWPPIKTLNTPTDFYMMPSLKNLHNSYKKLREFIIQVQLAACASLSLQVQNFWIFQLE